MSRPAGVAALVAAAVAVLALASAGCGDGDSLSGTEEAPSIAAGEAVADDPQAAASELSSDETAADAGVEKEDETAADAGAAGEPDGEPVPALPSKSNPSGYTQFVVQQAIDRYEADGLDAALDHFNDPANIDGQWYVFVVDSGGTVIGHPDPGLRGESLHGWVGTDINGYNFGPEMLAADTSGRWVPYLYVNPPGATLGNSDFELKNAWVRRRDGMMFGSGWYINTEQFVPQLITEAAEHFRTGGLEAILAFYNDPLGIATGLIPTVSYYNTTNTLDGDFAGFIAAPDGEILSHFDPALIGTPIEDLLGPAVRNATSDGTWITAKDNPDHAAGPETMRVFAVDVAGTIIGGGWYRS